MKLKKLCALFLASVSILMTGCSISGGTSSVSEETKIHLNVKDGEVLDCTPALYKDYLDLTNTNEIAKFLVEHNNRGAFKRVINSAGIVLSWKRDVSAYSRYQIWVSDKEDFSNTCFQASTTDTFISVDGLIPGEYYWKVADSLGRESDVDTFIIGDYVRALDVDSIGNFRDMGGWKTESGKKIKYGMSYRCAALKEDNGPALRDFGIKTEIDLRAGSEYAQSVISPSYGIGYLQAGIMQGDYVLKDKSFYSQLTPEQIEEKRHQDAAFQQEYADALYAAFKMYTVESNYPFVFHCTSGADRTGTFAFLLSGMLGVGLEDLYKDFELTCFSMGGKRWRSNVEKADDGTYYFNDDGYVTVPDNYIAIGLLYKGLMTCYATGDGKLSSAIKNYLRTDVGLTDADFQAIERLMLE